MKVSRIQRVKDVLRWPGRQWRRAGIKRRLHLARGWRTEIPPRLHLSIMRGLVDYEYRGVPTFKHPVEIALYLRLLWEVKPRTVFEIGSKYGGSALWLGDMLRSYGCSAQVISIDLEPPAPDYRPDNVRFLKGDAGDLHSVAGLDDHPHPWLVIEDASHEYRHCLAAMQYFAPRMRAGEYLVVEDGNMTEIGLDHLRDGGPARAIEEFLAARPDFEIDERYCDQYGRNVTGNPNGYLRKKQGSGSAARSKSD